MSESPEGDRVRSATRGDRKFGSSTGSEARAIAEVSGDSGRVRVAVRVRNMQLVRVMEIRVTAYLQFGVMLSETFSSGGSRKTIL